MARVSIKEVYTDDTLLGHCFLRPSLYFGRKVFVKSDEEQSLPKAVALHMLASMVFTPSLLLVPFGLALKGVHSVLRSDEQPQPIPTPSVPIGKNATPPSRIKKDGDDSNAASSSSDDDTPIGSANHVSEKETEEETEEEDVKDDPEPKPATPSQPPRARIIEEEEEPISSSDDEEEILVGRRAAQTEKEDNKEIPTPRYSLLKVAPDRANAPLEETKTLENTRLRAEKVAQLNAEANKDKFVKQLISDCTNELISSTEHYAQLFRYLNDQIDRYNAKIMTYNTGAPGFNIGLISKNEVLIQIYQQWLGTYKLEEKNTRKLEELEKEFVDYIHQFLSDDEEKETGLLTILFVISQMKALLENKEDNTREDIRAQLDVFNNELNNPKQFPHHAELLIAYYTQFYRQWLETCKLDVTDTKALENEFADYMRQFFSGEEKKETDLLAILFVISQLKALLENKEDNTRENLHAQLDVINIELNDPKQFPQHNELLIAYYYKIPQMMFQDWTDVNEHWNEIKALKQASELLAKKLGCEPFDTGIDTTEAEKGDADLANMMQEEEDQRGIQKETNRRQQDEDATVNDALLAQALQIEEMNKRH